MSPRKKAEPRAITVAEIEQHFELASYWWGEKWCPAVHSKGMGGYGIRVLGSVTVTGASRQVSYSYFELDADGLISIAPRGWARAYKPGRVIDIAEVADRFAVPQADAMRVGW